MTPSRDAPRSSYSWTLVEPCCGSGALTLHLLGARRPLVSYQGSKWPLRSQLEAVARRLGFFGQPGLVLLGDASPWGLAIATVLRQRAAVLDELRPLVERGEREPRELYAELAAEPVPADRPRMAARLLWLQRMSFASKAVGAVADRWVVHGLNTTSAFGVAGTDRFGAVRPQGAALLRAVEEAPRLDQALSVVGELPVEILHGRTLVYLDPPYQGTTGYPSGDMPREAVVDLARRWAMAGAAVVVSEAEAVGELVADGWEATQLAGAASRARRQQFRRGDSGEEWIVTHRPQVGARSAA